MFVIPQKCIDKEDKLYRGNNQVINLTTDYVWSGCKEKEVLNLTHLDCSGKKYNPVILMKVYTILLKPF